MRSTTRCLAYAALLALAPLPLVACGGSGLGGDNTGCVNLYTGQPSPCDHPNAVPAYKMGAERFVFPLSVNGAAVSDASGDSVRFYAQAPHGAEVRGVPAGDLVLDLQGRLLWRGMPAGWVVYAERPEGGRIAVLVDEGGRPLDVEVGPGSLLLRPTEVPVRLVAAEEVPSRPEVRALTTLPVAMPAPPPAAGG
jgi:hypothetical protein